MRQKLNNGQHGSFGVPPGASDDYAQTMQALAALTTRVGRLEEKIDRVVVDIAEMKGQLKNMPTLIGIGGTMLAINTGIVAVAALIVAVLRAAKLI